MSVHVGGRGPGHMARSSGATAAYHVAFDLDLDFRTSLPSGETFTRASSGTYVNSSGVIATASTDAARIEYDPVTLAARGLLIEGARTNLVLQSQTLGTTWTLPTGGSVSSNSANGPDGAATADKLQQGAAASTYRLQQGFTTTAGHPIAQSIFLKTADYPATWLFTATETNVSAYFNATSGSSGSGAANAANLTMTQFASSWWRGSYTYTSTVTNPVYRAYLAEAIGDTALPADAGATKGVLFWNAQAEDCSADGYLGPSSPIVTTTATVTRAVDSCIRSSTAFSDNWNATAMTIVVKFDSPGIGTRTIWQSDDNTANERVCLYTSGTTLKLMVVDGGSTVADITVGTITAYTQHWCAFRLEANNVGASLGGGEVVIDAAVTLPTVDRRRLGASTVAGEEGFGHIARERWFKQTVSNSTLRALALTGGA